MNPTGNHPGGNHVKSNKVRASQHIKSRAISDSSLELNGVCKNRRLLYVRLHEITPSLHIFPSALCISKNYASTVIFS